MFLSLNWCAFAFFFELKWILMRKPTAKHTAHTQKRTLNGKFTMENPFGNSLLHCIRFSRSENKNKIKYKKKQ